MPTFTARPRLVSTTLAIALVTTACASTNQRGASTVIDDTVITEAAPVDPAPSDQAAPAGSAGSTTSGVGGDATTPTDGSPTGQAEGGTTTTSPGQPPSPGSSAPTSTSSESPATTPGAGEPATQPGEPSPGTEVAMGPGVTAEKIVLGFQFSEDLQAGFAAVGASGDPPDERAIAQAYADWINANGGIRGRQVEIVHHGTNAAGGTWASQAQAACSTFTEDNEVFAVVSSAVGGDDSLLACLAEKGTPLVETNLWLFDQPYFDERAGLLYRPGKMKADVWVRAWIQGLDQIGYFQDAKVGILRFDAPVFERLADGVLHPELARVGVQDPVEIVVDSPSGLAGFGPAGSQMANAVVRFRAEGVTHVIMLENAGIMPFFFMQEAESQGYRPIYGLSSTDIPDTQAGQQEPEQLIGSVGISWTPPNDVNHEDHPGNPMYEWCRKVAEDNGITNLTGFYVQSRCDGMFFLKAALEAAPDLTRAGLVSGMEALGDSYLSPFTLGSSFGPGKPDGADFVAPIAFFEDCTCYRYTGPRYAIR